VHKPNEETKKVVDLFKKAKPNSIREIKKLGFSVRRVGNGAFRDVYSLRKTGLIVKIVQDSYGCNLDHHRDEIKAYTKIMTNRKYKLLHKYMPEIYYYEDGIVLMKEYKKFHTYGYDDTRINAVGSALLDLFNTVMSQKRNWRDFNNHGNIGLDFKTDQLVILDLGCF
jgi:hypothetical protein